MTTADEVRMETTCRTITSSTQSDRIRLLAYADALVARQGLPEDMAGFIQREAALTAAEAAFQAQTLGQPGLIARSGNSPDVD